MINKKSDGAVVRKDNQFTILQTIFEKGVISRVEISKMLNMSKSAVNEHIENLLRKGIITEIGEGDSASKGGRKPILITPNQYYKYIVAVDLNYTKPIIALGNILGSPIDIFLLSKNYDVSDVKQMVKESIDKLMINNAVTLGQIQNIVIALPGIVNDNSDNIIFNPQHEELHRLNLKQFLYDHYQVPVIIKNDVNMAAIAEEKFLRIEGKSNLLFLSCGNGLGAAIIIDGELYQGMNNAAGEIGYAIDTSTGKPLEELLMINCLIKEVKQGISEGRKSLLQNHETIVFEDIVSAYKQKDDLVLERIKNIGYLLGICANNAIAILDVDTVVLGGDYIIFKDTIIKEMQQVFTNSSIAIKPEVVPTLLAYDGGIIGCFAVGINCILETLEV